MTQVLMAVVLIVSGLLQVYNTRTNKRNWHKFAKQFNKINYQNRMLMEGKGESNDNTTGTEHDSDSSG